jgi:hypothetical protein
VSDVKKGGKRKKSENSEKIKEKDSFDEKRIDSRKMKDMKIKDGKNIRFDVKISAENNNTK